mgnify:CR=1 FL=1
MDPAISLPLLLGLSLGALAGCGIERVFVQHFHHRFAALSPQRFISEVLVAGCRARWLAMYLSYVTFGWPMDRVAHAFGLNRATAAAACRWACRSSARRSTSRAC